MKKLTKQLVQEKLRDTVLGRPYYIPLVRHLIVQEDPSIPIVGIRFPYLYFNPNFEVECENDLVYLLIHEIEHVLRNHEQRLKSIPIQIRNVVFDLEINDELPRAIVSAYKGIHPEDFGLPTGLTAEEYLIMLTEWASEQGKTTQDIINEMLNEGYHSCETCSINESHYHSDLDKVLEDVMRERGRLSGEFSSYTKIPLPIPEMRVDLLPDLYKDLVSMVRKPYDVTYKKLSRKYYALRSIEHNSPILPGLKKYNHITTQNIGLVIDTSASIENWFVRQVISALWDAFRFRRVIGFQTSGAVDEIEKDVDINNRIFHRFNGSTNLSQGLRAILKKCPNPALLVIATDWSLNYLDASDTTDIIKQLSPYTPIHIVLQSDNRFIIHFEQAIMSLPNVSVALLKEDGSSKIIKRSQGRR